MTTLYQKDSKGNIRVWMIYVDDTSNGIFIRSFSGIYMGNLIPCTTPIKEGLGGKTALEQANADMQTEINKKIKEGYVYDISLIKSKGQTATIDKPAKGLVYDPKGKTKDSYTIDKAKLRGKRVGVQVKLDGWRFRIWTDGTECLFYTSSGDIHIGFPHIAKAIRDSFPKFSEEYDVDSVILDGEIYNHELGFQATSSACGTSKHIDSEKAELRSKMQFYIFDIIGHCGFYTNRYEIISRYFVDCEIIMPVETAFMIADEKLIDKLFEGYLKQGYEGLIIRQLDVEYQHKKSKQFFKYKPLIDSEFPIVGFKKSITGETLGSLTLSMPDGREFDANMKDDLGSDITKQKIWNNRYNYLDKIVTVEFLEYTEAGFPRLPRAKCFRDKIDIS